MVVHLVSFRYRSDVDAAARQDHRSRLSALADIDGILDLKVGEDFVRSPRLYDTGWSSRSGIAPHSTWTRHTRAISPSQNLDAILAKPSSPWTLMREAALVGPRATTNGQRVTIW